MSTVTHDLGRIGFRRNGIGVEPHGLSLLRRSSFGYEGRAAVAPLRIFSLAHLSIDSLKAFRPIFKALWNDLISIPGG